MEGEKFERNQQKVECLLKIMGTEEDTNRDVRKMMQDSIAVELRPTVSVLCARVCPKNARTLTDRAVAEGEL